MGLQPGQMLAHYRIVERIGSGGMGEVWSAEDTRLKRTVALKVLPSHTAGDPRLRARFEREAQAVAALNHPNIVTIHSVEDAEGILFLTMELVDGEPLSKRIRGGMGLDQVFAVAIPLADAVGVAHERGILHRDLKPDNVMVTRDGAVKVLDFGLAKLREQISEQPTEPGPNDTLTRDGGIVGTAAYMSPEQAEGKPVGPPADVFALGIILYQMATGERPFSGSTPISLISSILKEEPRPVTEINRALPRHLGRIVRRCLAKDPSRRYSTARELRNELELLKQELAAQGGDPERATDRRNGRAALWGTGAALLVMTAVAVLGWLPRDGGGNPPPGMMVAQQTFDAGVETAPSLSPDGQFLLYVAASGAGNSDILLQRVDGQTPINLTEDSPVFDGQPAFSPDGKQIAFRSERHGGGIYVMGATGEAVRRLTDGGYDPAWSPDGSQIVFAGEAVESPWSRWDLSGLWVVDVETGEQRKITDGDAVQPSWSPDGGRIAYWTARIGEPLSGQRDIVTVRRDGSDPVMVTDDLAVDWRPLWSPDGRQLYFASDRGGSMNLWRVPVDQATGRSRGSPEPVTMPSLWSGPFAVSGDGAAIAYVARDDRSRLIATTFDPEAGMPVGDAETITRGALLVDSWEVSPDGEWIALTNTGRQEDLYLMRPDGSLLRRLTDDLHKDRGVTWLDTEHLLIYTTRGGGYEIWTLRRDGSDFAPITSTTGQSLWDPKVSPDGTRLLASNFEGTYIFDLTGERPLRKETAAHIRGEEMGPDGGFRAIDWSPDGTRLLGTVGTAQASQVALYDLPAKSLRVLDAPVPGAATVGGWLPDGRRFIVAVGGSAWVVTAADDAWRRLPLAVEVAAAKLTVDGRTLHYVENVTEADIWVAWLR